EDLLEHVVIEEALLGIARIPVDLLDVRFNGVVVGVENLPGVAAQDAHLAILEIDHALRLAQQGGRVAGQKLLAIADADDERAPKASADQQVRSVAANDGEAVGSL